MTKWRDEVIGALEDIGGRGSLSEIYEAVRKRRTTPLPENWQAIVRRELEHNSSDTKSFKHRFDLFKSENLGTGFWSLRDVGEVNRPDGAWTATEVALLVSDYLAMLAAELQGEKYNKAAHRRKLMLTITRSEGSIERKHQNVSAVMRELGYPWIVGYKPLGNFQKALSQEVLVQLHTEVPGIESSEPAAVVTNETLASVFVDRPAGRTSTVGRSQRGATAKKVDFALLEANNSLLGRAGEEFVLNVERARLADIGMTKHSKRVRWVARDDGDGLGYDVLSFDENGDEIFIEVKTTRGGSLTPFYLTEPERLAARRLGAQYRLYRVFHFGRNPSIFVLPGPLETGIRLVPTHYRASLVDEDFDPVSLEVPQSPHLG